MAQQPVKHCRQPGKLGSIPGAHEKVEEEKKKFPSVVFNLHMYIYTQLTKLMHKKILKAIVVVAYAVQPVLE